MEPLFTNKSTYTKPNLMEVNKGTSSRKSPTIFLICTGFIIFVCGLLTADYLYCLLGVLSCVIYPLFSTWGVRHSATARYEQLLQLYHGEAEPVTGFYEDHFVVRNIPGDSDITVAYPQIAKVYETQNLYYLMLSTRIGFMLEKNGFEGTTADEFGKFIRARAVGEGRADLKKRNRKSARIGALVFSVFLAIGISFGFLGPAIENTIPETFTYGDYSIKLTKAFDGYGSEWQNQDVSVYCYYETNDELRANGFVCQTAAAYLQDINEYYGIDGVVTAVSDTRAWAVYTDTYEGNEYYNYDYVIKTDEGFWYTEFYCLAEDTDKYAPLFEKWAQSIMISLPL